MGVLLGLIWWAWLELRGTRDIRLVGQGIEESKELVNATLVLFGAIAIVSYAVGHPYGYGVTSSWRCPWGMGLLLHGPWADFADNLSINGSPASERLERWSSAARPGVLETVGALQEAPRGGLRPRGRIRADCQRGLWPRH